MSTPKIKLYRLPTGYSSANDNDIQNATNDQLLPVVLKNVMPSQAYTLVGVSYKQSQVLIPTIHVDAAYDDSITSLLETNLISCVNGSGFWYIPRQLTVGGTTYQLGKYLVGHKSEMCPKFYYIQTTNNTQSRKYFVYGTDYQYVQDITDYTASSSDIKFVFGFNESQKYWEIKQIGTQLADVIGSNGTLYVSNLYTYQLDECVAHFKVVDKSTTYYLTKSEQCQATQNPNEFMPLLQDGLPRHLRTRIYYTSDLITEDSSSSSDSSDSSYSTTAYNMQLTEQLSDFSISVDYKLSGIISSRQTETLNIPYNDVYGKTVTLVYYTIKRNLTDNKRKSGYYNKTLDKFYQDEQFTTEITPKLGVVYKDLYNVYKYDFDNGFVQTDQLQDEVVSPYSKIQCYYNPNDNKCYSDSIYNYVIQPQDPQHERYIVLNNNYRWNFYNDYYRTHQQSTDYSTLVNKNQRLYSSYSQRLYNGTPSSTKPNTLFLEYVKMTDVINWSFSIDNASARDITLSNYQNDLYTTISKLVTPTQLQVKILQYVGQDTSSDSFIGVSRGIINNHNRADTTAPTIQWRGCQNGTFEYLLDVYKGLFDFKSYSQSQQFDEYQYDYFYCDYYYEDSPTKLFVSDYQCWVTQHLRNNPDIFYGKKDYQGDDYIDANDNAIATGVVPCYLQDGYTIQYRNGAVSFGASRQDLNFTGGAETNTSIVTDESTGVISGGIARANFAYYAGIQNVVQQKLDYDPSYAGGGYKYKALNDKQYPDSLNKRWVSRDNTSQFIGLSFTTKKLNSSGQLADYNLPDLETTQLQSLTQFGFQIGQDKSSGSDWHRIQRSYDILTNQFSYPHTYKINNLNEKIISSSDIRNKYVTKLTQLQLRQIHSTLKDADVTDTYYLATDDSQFQHNDINFLTLQNQLLDTINVDYCQVATLPAIKVTAPVFTNAVNTNNLYRFKVEIGQKYSYSNFKIYIKAYKVDEYSEMLKLTPDDGEYCIVLNKLQDSTLSGSKFKLYRYIEEQFIESELTGFSIDSAQSLSQKVCVFIEDIQFSKVTQQVVKTVSDTQTLVDQDFYVTQDLRYLKDLFNQIYLKFYKTCTLFRSYITYDETLLTSDDSITYLNKTGIQTSSDSSSSESSYDVSLGKQYIIPNGYKQLRTSTDSIIFSISNLSQTTYFNFKVLDIFNMANTYNQTVVFSIKKNQDIQV